MIEQETRTLSMPAARPTRKPFLKRRKFLIGSIVLVLAFGLLIYQGIASTGMYYLSVKEFKALDAKESSQQVRIGGKVQDGSVNWEPQSMTLRFVVVDDQPDGETVSVLYRGVVPDSFKPGAEVVLEGRDAGAAGVFEAKTLLTKCASKYTPLVG
ncbi:MAG: cytochrome c maturation protein CcmE [Chloroflexota bacterium]